MVEAHEPRGGLLDGLIRGQAERIYRDKVMEVTTPERDEEFIEQILDELDQSGNPIVSQLDDIFRKVDIHHMAEALSRIERKKLLGTTARMMAGPNSGELGRLRRRAVFGLRRSEKAMTREEREAAVASISDDQLKAAVDQVQQKVNGCAMAATAGGIGDWLATAWQFIKDHWLQILQAIAAILGIALLLL